MVERVPHPDSRAFSWRTKSWTPWVYASLASLSPETEYVGPYFKGIAISCMHPEFTRLHGVWQVLENDHVVGW